MARRVGRAVLVQRRRDASLRDQVLAGVERDSIEPGREPRTPVERADRLVRRHERLLQSVLGVAGIPAEAQGDGVDAIPVTEHELVERATVAALGEPDESFVCRGAEHRGKGSVPVVRTDELDYVLPPELIAQTPAEPRDSARLLHLDRGTGTIAHRVFGDLPALLRADDVIVLNATRVFPARVRCLRSTGGASEVLLLEPGGDGTWTALARPARRLRPGEVLAAPGLDIEIVAVESGGQVIVRPLPSGSLEVALARAGEMPLPPYIHEPLDDPERYQTVYADRPGSAAAPTAGLHFTADLLARVRSRWQVEVVHLDVGVDTFRPVTVDDLDEHAMHSEPYLVDPACRARLVAARREGRRLVAIGTTTARVLETIADPQMPDEGRTSLKIQPGHEFSLVDALVTNFHLPRSTLLALVMAFAGADLVRKAYAVAIAERYRFYSFGDAMLIE